MELLTDSYQADLLGVLSCYDRIIITGTLTGCLLRTRHDGFSEFPSYQNIRLSQSICRAFARARPRDF